MLFDHGADAVTAFLLALQCMKILNLSYDMQLFAIYIFIMNTYFCAMWSQYCVGYFRLGVINPVDEGLPTYATLCIVATQLDLSVINEFHILGTYGEEVVYLLLVLLIPVDYSLCIDIFKKSTKPMSEILFMLLLYIAAGVCCLAVYSKTGTMTSDVFYPFYYCLAFMWSQNMILIQLQFVVGQIYQVFNLATNLLIASVAIFYFLGDYLPITASQYFIMWAVIQAIVLLEFVTSSFYEIAVMLNIYIFSIKKRVKSV